MRTSWTGRCPRLTREEDDEAESEATVRSGSMAASAIGLAFSVPTDVGRVTAAASWGRYERSALGGSTRPSRGGRGPRGTGCLPGGAVEMPLEAEGRTTWCRTLIKRA